MLKLKWLFLLLICLFVTHQKTYAWEIGKKIDGKDNTHHWIVQCAVEVLDANGRKEEADLMAKWKTQWEQGLFDADHLSPYCSKIPQGWVPLKRIPEWVLKMGVKDRCTFLSHFYDPDIDGNWLSPRSQSKAKKYFDNLTDPNYQENAKTNGAYYFNQAGEYFKRGEHDKAFYYLGISLHYMTDAAMPFHAANYTYFDSTPYGYHSFVETYAAKIQAEFKARDGKFRIAGTPGDWIVATAKDAKTRSVELLAGLNPSINKTIEDQIHGSIGVSIVQAQRFTAGYIDLWFHTFVR